MRLSTTSKSRVDTTGGANPTMALGLHVEMTSDSRPNANTNEEAQHHYFAHQGPQQDGPQDRPQEGLRMYHWMHHGCTTDAPLERAT